MYFLAYSSLLILIITLELNRTKKAKVDTLTLFNLGFAQSYVIPALLWSAIPGIYYKNTSYKLHYNAAEKVEVLLIILVSYISFVFFYTTLNRIKPFALLAFNEFKTKSSPQKKIITICSIFPIIVLINIFLFGGINEYIASSNEARHFKKSIGIAGYLNYFLSGTSFVILTLLYLKDNSTKKALNIWVYLLIAILLIGLVARGGRGAIVSLFIYIILFKYYLGRLNINIKNIAFMIFSLLASLFVIYYLRDITANILSGKPALNGIDTYFFFRELSVIILKPFQYFTHYLFTIAEFFQAPSVYNHPRLGSDILTGLLLVVPGISSEHYGLAKLPDIINQVIMGKSDGYIPPGWVGWSLIDGGVIYLIIKLFISAFACSFIDKSYASLAKSSTGILVYFILIIFIIDLLFVGTAMNLFRGSAGKFLFIFLFIIIPHIRVGKIRLIKTNNFH